MDILDQESPPPLKNIDKWILSAMIGVIFIIIASPFSFKLSEQVFGFVKIRTMSGNNPNYVGWVIHTIAFIVIIRLLMK